MRWAVTVRAFLSIAVVALSAAGATLVAPSKGAVLHRHVARAHQSCKSVSRTRRHTSRCRRRRAVAGQPQRPRPSRRSAPASSNDAGLSSHSARGVSGESPQGQTRRLVWSDEFGGAAGGPPSSSWNFDTGGAGWGNDELQSYTSRPQNASLDRLGHLVITARSQSYTGDDGIRRSFTSARLQTLHKFELTYGALEARIQVPAGQGLLPQFWMLGNNAYRPGGWPASGEIDAMEVLGSQPKTVAGTIHGPWPSAPTGLGGSTVSAVPLSAGFHTYGVEWSPTRISFMLDGAVYATVTPASLPAGSPWPFQHPFFLLLDLAVGGVWPGSPDSTTAWPAHMTVDWVRAWQ
jgi:beta-glucanase (GH16 family)